LNFTKILIQTVRVFELLGVVQNIAKKFNSLGSVQLQTDDRWTSAHAIRRT